MDKANLQPIFEKFTTEGRWRGCERYGSGHIHDTYRIITAGSSHPGYILQRINTNVFHDVPLLQSNITVVTDHFRRKLRLRPGSDPLRECLTPVYTPYGRTWHCEPDGSCWRMFVFIPDHQSFDRVENESLALEGGKAVGRFVAMLSDLPGSAIGETIPDFHNTPLRISRFAETLSRDAAGRAHLVRRETEAITSRAKDMHIIADLGAGGEIPLRVTHNDTKFNNVLLDKSGRALCLIDLDTVMPGYVHYDFGDAIRTAANTSDEDACDIESVGFSLPFFSAWSRGFAGETKGILTTTETEWLWFAPILITYEQALRFLADYIDGDRYYKVHDKDHNLRRARAQLKLLEEMEKAASEMKKIITRLFA